MTDKVWFITGASSGFGRCMAEYVLSLGGKVVATLRKPEALDDLKALHSASKLLILKLDVNKSDEIAEAFDQVKKHSSFGRIDVVFNNAGWSIFGEVEGTPEEKARQMFETNFWGASNVSREAVKFFREVNTPPGGMLIVNSSVVGSAPSPSIGYYSASKAALEALTEAMVKEFDSDWNIRATIVQPGMFGTNALANSVRAPPHPTYTKPTLVTNVLRQAMKAPDAIKHSAGDPKIGVQIIYKLTELEKPPLRFVLGKRALALLNNHTETLLEEMKTYGAWSNELDGGVEAPKK